jgi:hypothetical protein
MSQESLLEQAQLNPLEEKELKALEVKKSNTAERIKSVKSGGIKLEFTGSPTAKFGLAYHIGESASFSKNQAEMLIEAGVAKKV